MLKMTLKNGAVYTLTDEGAVTDRSDGPRDWDYSGKWIITGFSTRFNSRAIIPLESVLRGAPVGHGFIHDLDHGTRRMWANPTGRRLARLERVA
jgi:hypothetical protein